MVPAIFVKFYQIVDEQRYNNFIVLMVSNWHGFRKGGGVGSLDIERSDERQGRSEWADRPKSPSPAPYSEEVVVTATMYEYSEVQGGVPIKAGETVIGAVGASGGTVDQDVEVAEAAAAVLAEA